MLLAEKMVSSRMGGIRRLMEEYAQRGVFRGFSRQPTRAGVMAFKMTWHRDLVFDLLVDPGRKTITIPRVLPGVPVDIYADFKRFVAAHHNADLPDHRRIEKCKVRVRCANRRGSVSMAMAVKDDDYEYALQRLIHLIHEVFLIFINDGAYRDYRVAQLGDDPDWG
jgi:hypothetical protein